MSNRILKQSICTSESIDQLDWFEEVFYYRLIVNVDDYGVFDARPKILKASLFPLREVKLSQVEKAIASLSSKGLIHLYTVEGRPFLNLPSWAEHQRVRNSKHKFPTPDQEDSLQTAESCGELRRVAANCRRLQKVAALRAHARNPESRIQNPNPESRIQNPKPKQNPKCVARSYLTVTPCIQTLLLILYLFLILVLVKRIKQVRWLNLKSQKRLLVNTVMSGSPRRRRRSLSRSSV